MPSPVPPELADAVTRVSQAVATGDLPLARIHASVLEEQATRTFGPEHHYTLEAYALHAYVAHLNGDQGTSTALSLRLAELRHRNNDPRALEDLHRAGATWELLTTPYNAVPLGKTLLALWTRLTHADDSREAPIAIERRLSAFTRVTAPPFAAHTANTSMDSKEDTKDTTDAVNAGRAHDASDSARPAPADGTAKRTV